ncbi:hypothetical protein Msil_0973 [Methylocella silvestris BL2]|uniref:Uncharacterized protein n=1 Tax=Methylocella silvestris (strain DSM 15510 / CIP 108128 / LMG 27833 / NCIMB 13906 / BL2) TaxID=395965 RepID=B8EJZ5_METSB|nr:hypothetical protein [Methylocella silvestris]ACK49942.1 hypothetical protein Msil_0973 [Methylocella silvestris BL2]
MSEHQSHAPEVAGQHADAPAEHLFFAQYRYWMAGYATRDMFCWDCAWDTLLRYVAPEAGKALYAEFHLFTRVLNQSSRRPIGWLPDLCRCLCRDEYWVLNLVAASQQGQAHEELLAAAELVGIDEARALLGASRSLARALKAENFVLAPLDGVLSRIGRAERAPAQTTWH